MAWEIIDSEKANEVNQINVTSSYDFLDVIDSNKEYFIRGIIDMTGVSIEIPEGGINLKGYGFNLSGLVCSDNNYTMFTSPAGGSGDVSGIDYFIEVTGTSSKVYDIKSVTGNEAFEFQRVNYINCTSGGIIDNYRQGLETGTGRFGGNPSIELVGAWSGGYRITTSIARGMSDTAIEPLFKAGTNFVMQSRFLTDINIDLGTLQPFADFAAINFPNPSTLQVNNGIFTRDFISNADDTNIFPNILPSDLSSIWKNNQGLKNTFVGGGMTVSAEVATPVAAINTFYDLNGMFTAYDLQHFDSPSNGQLRHLGSTPREFRLFGDLVLVSNANDVLTVRALRWDDSASTFIEEGRQRRQVNSLVGSRDVAFFNIVFELTLDKNDYIKLEVSSDDTNNVTVEIDSFVIIGER